MVSSSTSGVNTWSAPANGTTTPQVPTPPPSNWQPATAPTPTAPTERYAQVYLQTYGQSPTPTNAPVNRATATGRPTTNGKTAQRQPARRQPWLRQWLWQLQRNQPRLVDLPARARAIVSQADWGQKQLDYLNQLRSYYQSAAALPTTARVGMLSAIIFVLWWTWPTDPLTLVSATTQPLALAAPAAPQASGVNAVAAALLPVLQSSANAPAAANQSANQGLNAILVPTPTATKAEGEVSPTQETNTAANTDSAVTTVVVPLRNVQTTGRSGLAGLLVPTSTPARIDAAVITVSVPNVEVIPGVEVRLPFGQPSPTPTITPEPTATPVPINLSPGRLWSAFTPATGAENDHYWVGRPFAPNISGQLASPSYQFGSTAGDRYRTHHGVDISNPFGTPVLAATDGEVIHAGPDDPALLGPYNNFYGNAVVIRLNRQLAVAGGQLDVFLLYGHLSQVTVSVGQQVRPEDVIGMVGMTGIAIGPHLHVEIRLGSNTYYNNVNPYLWMTPFDGQGSVAVRVLTADGRTWPGAYISIVRYAGGTAAWARQIVTYQDVENIGPDPAWGENGAMDGIPAGSYYVVGNVNGERVSAQIEVNPGQTTFVELRTQQ